MFQPCYTHAFVAKLSWRLRAISPAHADEGEISRQVAVRMARQHRLTEPDAPQLWVVLNEAVIRRLVGDRTVMRAQLVKLSELSGAPNVVIQVLPFSAGAHPAMDSAGQLAESLGETLERAKIWHTRAELLLRDGDASRARELAISALEIFTLSRTRYDITHARVTLSRATLASGQERLAIQQGALARSAVQVMGYDLLCVLYPEDVFDLAGRIDGALSACACGDALGVPWESPSNANVGAAASQIEQLPAREG